QRKIAELEERGGSEIGKRQRHDQKLANEDSFRVPHEEEVVAQGIDATQQDREANGCEQVSRRQQHSIAASPSKAPDQRDQLKSQKVERTEPQQPEAKRVASPHDEER